MIVVNASVEWRLFRHRSGFQSAAANPLEDGSILPALLVAWPALSAVVGCQIVPDVAGAVCWPCWLDQHQAPGRIIDVHYVHSVLVILLAVLVRIHTGFIGRRKFEDDVAGMTEYAGLSVRSLGGQNGLDLGYEIIEVKH